MILKALSKYLCISVFLGQSVFSCFADGLALTPVNGSPGSDSRPFVFGWEFSVSSAVTITGLAYLDPTARGLGESHPVGIFDSSTGNLLVSATVPAGSSTPFQNGFRVKSVSYTLQPGTYTIAAQRLTDADPVMRLADSVQVAPQITYLREREAQTSVFSMPTTTFDLVGIGDFGPSFTIAEDNFAGKAVTSISNSGSFQQSFSPGVYISVFGTKLANTNRAWNAADFGGGNRLPTSLDGVSATVGGLPAYVEFVSTGQINLVAPNVTPAASGVSVVVKYPGQPDVSAWVAVDAVSPSFFTWLTGTADSGKYAVAQHTDFTNVGKTGLYPSLPANFTTPARAGETIILYGTGFGPTTPQPTQGLLADKGYPLLPLPTATVGGLNAQVTYAGLVPTLAGVYQVNLVLPANIGAGDWPLIVTTGGTTSYSELITVR